MKGKLIIVSGPSGSGKSTVTKLVKDKLNIPLSISATTRQPRVGEIDGKDYFFLTKEIFEQKIKNDEFYEYANVHGNYYGTLKEVVENNLNKGLNVILEIDVQGALIAKEKKKEKKTQKFDCSECICCYWKSSNSLEHFKNKYFYYH